MHREAIEAIRRELQAASKPERREKSADFFKAGAGEYGEGDSFYGTPVPAQRKIAARRHRELDLEDVDLLLASPLHEERFVGLVVLVRWYERAGDPEERSRLARHYIERFDAVNNWDLVDATAPKILGPYAASAGTEILYEWAEQGELWRRRAAVLATFHFIRNNEYDHTIALAERLLHHPHDLIHKAIGWMLREIGKRDEARLHAFLREHCREMPRTMLRYAIEKLPESVRRSYLNGEL